MNPPTFFYGTAWKKDETARLVQRAVRSGFRAIDTANQPIHYREALVGEALATLAEEGFSRASLFLQTKFTPIPGHGGSPPPYDASASLSEQVAQSFESSLEHLGTDHVDSYLLHGPYSRTGLSDADREVWEAITSIHRSGRAHRIGVSNVTAGQLELLCETQELKPMVVQNRCFAMLQWDREVRDVCREHGVVYQGFSLLTANQPVLAHPAIHELARKYDTGPAQIVFRFAIDVGMVPLTGTTREDHMRDDLRVDEFELTPDEVKAIEAIAG